MESLSESAMELEVGDIEPYAEYNMYMPKLLPG